MTNNLRMIKEDNEVFVLKYKVIFLCKKIGMHSNLCEIYVTLEENEKGIKAETLAQLMNY